VLGAEPRFAEDIFVTRPIAPERVAYAALTARVFEDRWFTNSGPLAIELEERLRIQLGVGCCTTFCNGTAALLTALRSLDLRGEVITTPFTFPATPHCIEWNGLTPVFGDIDPETYNLDPARVEEQIGPDTCAILPVHVFGNPCDVDGLQAVADRHGLRLVYDAAHAFGVELAGEPIGRFGDLSALSFHATKVFHTAEGGAVVASDPALAERLRLLRNFGIVNENEVHGVGLNGKMSELHAAMGLLVLDALEAEIEQRGRLSDHYHARLKDVEGLSFQRIATGTLRNHFNFTVQIDRDAFGLSRDEVHAALRPDGIVSRKYFYPLCTENECYASLPSANRDDLPSANRLAGRILSLPLYGSLGESDVDAIVDTLLALQESAPAVRRAVAGEMGRAT
jgi:dTDP-4-amino-4,6-dideoxygalactose transaminase